jgi:hypothetical protein
MLLVWKYMSGVKAERQKSQEKRLVGVHFSHREKKKLRRLFSPEEFIAAKLRSHEELIFENTQIKIL